MVIPCSLPSNLPQKQLTRGIFSVQRFFKLGIINFSGQVPSEVIPISFRPQNVPVLANLVSELERGFQFESFAPLGISKQCTVVLSRSFSPRINLLYISVNELKVHRCEL